MTHDSEPHIIELVCPHCRKGMFYNAYDKPDRMQVFRCISGRCNELFGADISLLPTVAAYYKIEEAV